MWGIILNYRSASLTVKSRREKPKFCWSTKVFTMFSNIFMCIYKGNIIFFYLFASLKKLICEPGLTCSKVFYPNTSFGSSGIWRPAVIIIVILHPVTPPSPTTSPQSGAAADYTYLRATLTYRRRECTGADRDVCMFEFSSAVCALQGVVPVARCQQWWLLIVPVGSSISQPLRRFTTSWWETPQSHLQNVKLSIRNLLR